MGCERPRGGSTACAVNLIPTPYCTCIYKYVHVHPSHLMLASLALNLVLSHVRWESCPCGSVRALHADDVRPDSSTGRIGRVLVYRRSLKFLRNSLSPGLDNSTGNSTGT
jgi:hypothetical protein